MPSTWSPIFLPRKFCAWWPVTSKLKDLPVEGSLMTSLKVAVGVNSLQVFRKARGLTDHHVASGAVRPTKGCYLTVTGSSSLCPCPWFQRRPGPPQGSSGLTHRSPAMRLQVLLALALSTLALAGCSGSDDAEATAAVTSGGLPARELPWTLTNCRFAAFVLGVPAAAVEPFVPDGFTVQSAPQVAIGGQTGLPVPNPVDDGNLGIEAFECDEGMGLDGPVAGMTYASFFVGVEPPADL